ncbi:MAG: VOC family protein [Bacteroidaceae bacterium]|nr:VOC family protein [Bacteroidaceae bacterium]
MFNSFKLSTMAVFAMVMVACSPAREPQSAEPSESPSPVKATFNEANFPKQGVDVADFSGGIQHIGLPTADVQRTIEFYEGLGFHLATRHDINGRDFAFMQLGTLFLELIPNASPAMEAGAVDHFCLDVKNIDALYEKIRSAGYHMLSDGIQDIAFWDKGARYFFIQGPNNEKIEFCEIL